MQPIPRNPTGSMTRDRSISRLFERFTLLNVFTALTVAGHAHAQSAGNKAAAEAVFDQGKQLMQAGDYRQACLKFEASQKLDQGIGTLLYLADCYEKLGRTASAWATFKEAASMAGAQGQENRQKLAAQRARALEPNLVRLTVEVAQGNENVVGFEVRQDNTTIPPAQFATPFPVDPGTHRIEASAPGKKTHSEVVNVTRGTTHVSIPVLADLAPAAAPTEPPLGSAAPATSPQQSTPVSMITGYPASAPKDRVPEQGKTQRILSYVSGGLGVVGLGLGTYFGITALRDNSASKDSCRPDDPNQCSQLGYDQRQDALREARISTIAFSAGGALLATAAVLYFTAPNDHRVTARAQVSGQAALLNLQANW